MSWSFFVSPRMRVTDSIYFVRHLGTTGTTAEPMTVPPEPSVQVATTFVGIWSTLLVGIIVTMIIVSLLIYFLFPSSRYARVPTEQAQRIYVEPTDLDFLRSGNFVERHIVV